MSCPRERAKRISTCTTNRDLVALTKRVLGSDLADLAVDVKHLLGDVIPLLVS